MNTKKLIILAVAAVAAVGLGIWIASDRSSRTNNTTNVLYPQLKKSLNDVTAVRVFTSGNQRSVQIARKDDTWVVTERHEYPADAAKVRKLLLHLADAEIQEEKTSNPENYAALGVEDLTTADASGVRIELAGTTPVVDLIVGKQGPGLESQYVRRASEEKSWLIDSDLDTSSSPTDWLAKTVLDVAADRIQSVRIETSGAKPYTAAKTSKADADFAVEGLPKGKKLSSSSAANSLATALASLTLSDVQTADAFKDAAKDKAVYQTFDGLLVELQGWSREDKRYVALQSRFDQALADRFKVPSESTAEKSQDEQPKDDATAASAATPAATGSDVSQQASELNGRVKGWVFEIPDYKYDAIFKPVSELLAD